jgi:competence CoiA-like predicted nuclease
MARHDRLIKLAYDTLSDKTLNADELFGVTKSAFEVRKQFHQNKFELHCKECDQQLEISTSKYDRLHFKHVKGATYCILKDEDLSPEEREKFTLNLTFKESDRHKFLKNKIGELLTQTNGIDVSSIAVDNKFIVRENEKRRPDVYCIFQSKQVVFEIQLSNLSLRYILSRHDFYRKHGIFLIWILDDFDVHGQNQMERDIKYLNQHQNFFKLDESSSMFKMVCDYKYAFLTEQNILLTPWTKRAVTLAELTYDPHNYQVHYYDLEANKIRKEHERQERIAQLRKDEQQKVEDRLLIRSKDKAKEIIEEIKRLHKQKIQNFAHPSMLIGELSESEVSIFNEELKISKTPLGKTPALHRWFQGYSIDDFGFVHFILSNNRIWFDVNETNASGESSLVTLYKNKTAPKYLFTEALLKRGYMLTLDDEAFLRSTSIDPDIDAQIYIFKVCSDLTEKKLVDKVFNFQKQLLIIQSAKQGKFIGYNFKGNGAWIAFANNAIEYHSEYWEYFELAFKQYGLWDKLIESDKNGSFHQKLEEFYKKMPTQRYDFDRIFRRVFKEFETVELQDVAF